MTLDTPPRRTAAPTQLDLTLPWCFTDQHRDWRETVRRFAETEVAPGSPQRYIEGRFDPELMPKLASLGVFGLRVSERMGGSGGDLTSLCIAEEELARIDSSCAVSLHAQAISLALLDHLGRDEQKQDLLDAAVRGDAYVCFGLTEPSSGSDAGNVLTRARRDGGDWIINGAKQFITNAGFSGHVILFAATGEGAPGRPAVSAFLVPLDAPGVTVAPGYPKMGWTASDTRPLFFEDVRVPGEALLGVEGRAYREALGFLTWARLPIAAMGVGVSQGCLDETVRFVQERESFGKAIAEHQAVAFSVAEIAAMTTAARLVTYDACYRADHDLPFEREAAIAKLTAAELANRVAYAATQLHGGYGFVDEQAVARHYRDARILTIGEGTSEIQKLLIARSLGLRV